MNKKNTSKQFPYLIKLTFQVSYLTISTILTTSCVQKVETLCLRPCLLLKSVPRNFPHTKCTKKQSKITHRTALSPKTTNQMDNCKYFQGFAKIVFDISLQFAKFRRVPLKIAAILQILINEYDHVQTRTLEIAAPIFKYQKKNGKSTGNASQNAPSRNVIRKS